MKYAWRISLSAVVLALAGLASAQVSIEPPSGGGDGGGGMSIAPPGGGSAPVVTTTQAAPPATLPSAQSVLQNLINDQAGVGGGGAGAATQGAARALIAPSGPELGPDGLLREGQQLAMRNGHLEKGAAGMMFIFEDKQMPHYPPMGVVPSHRLEAMENAAGFGEGLNGKDMNFPIDAEVTQYRGKNYLYIKSTGVRLPPPAKPVPVDTTPLAQPAAPNVPPAQPVPERTIVSNRIGRLVKDPQTGAELIAFDADGKLLADPPMGVIPCKYLAVIEDATDHGAKPMKFRVSGEVTAYRNKNYLYLKFVQAVRDLNGGIGAGDNPVMPADASGK